MTLWYYNTFLAKRYYIMAYGTSRLYVVCLSVMLLHPRKRLELFGDIFAPTDSSGARTVCIKILGKNLKGF